MAVRTSVQLSTCFVTGVELRQALLLHELVTITFLKEWRMKATCLYVDFLALQMCSKDEHIAVLSLSNSKENCFKHLIKK